MSCIWYGAETLTGVKHPCRKAYSCKARPSSLTFWQGQTRCKIHSSLRQPEAQVRPREFLEERVQERRQQEGERTEAVYKHRQAQAVVLPPLCRHRAPVSLKQQDKILSQGYNGYKNTLRARGDEDAQHLPAVQTKENLLPKRYLLPLSLSVC